MRGLFNFDPPATELEIRHATLQFVPKPRGFKVPSRASEAAFERPSQGHRRTRAASACLSSGIGCRDS